MIVVLGGICLNLFKGTVLLGYVILSFKVGAKVSSGLGLLHQVKHMRKLIRIVIERFQNLRVELHIVIAVIKEVLREIALRQIRILDDLVGAFARIRASHPFHHGMTGVVVGIHDRSPLQLCQAVGGILVLKNGVLRDLSGKLSLGQEHCHRHLVHAGTVIPFVAIVIPGIAGFQITETDADASALLVKAILRHKIIHHLLQFGSIDESGSHSRRRRGNRFLCESMHPERAQQHSSRQQGGKSDSHFHRILTFSVD